MRGGGKSLPLREREGGSVGSSAGEVDLRPEEDVSRRVPLFLRMVLLRTVRIKYDRVVAHFVRVPRDVAKRVPLLAKAGGVGDDVAVRFDAPDLISSKMLGGASQIVSMIRVQGNGK